MDIGINQIISKFMYDKKAVNKLTIQGVNEEEYNKIKIKNNIIGGEEMEEGIIVVAEGNNSYTLIHTNFSLSSEIEGRENTNSLEVLIIQDIEDNTTIACNCLTRQPVERIEIRRIKSKSLNSVTGICKYISGLKELIIEDIKLPKVTNINKVLSGGIDLENIEVNDMQLGRIKEMEYSFDSLRKLDSLDLSKLDLRSVENIEGAFMDSKIKNLNLGNLSLDKVENISCMFMGFEGDTLDLTMLNTENVIDYRNLFDEAVFNKVDISTFTLNSKVQLANIFYGASIKELILGDMGVYDKAILKIKDSKIREDMEKIGEEGYNKVIAHGLSMGGINQFEGNIKTNCKAIQSAYKRRVRRRYEEWIE